VQHDAAVPVLRTFHHGDFEPAALAATKAGARVSVCLPARDEEATVGSVVTTIRRELVDAVGLVDEVVVVDDGSADRTATVARAAGARVVGPDDVPEAAEHLGTRHGGKGGALWRSLLATEGDLVVWVDADIRDFAARFVTGLVGPLLTRPDVDFVKGFYDRPAEGGEGGGRVTELVARPVVALLFPHLAAVVQPLAGEYAGRRELLERIPFVEGYGVDLALLVDVAAEVGTEAMAQVDLGTRVHRNRPLTELGPQALEVLQAALQRARPGLAVDDAQLIRPGLAPHGHRFAELPPVADVVDRARRSA
jgi:glucosyl-3-phosphoglycerate synthase